MKMPFRKLVSSLLVACLWAGLTAVPALADEAEPEPEPPIEAEPITDEGDLAEVDLTVEVADSDIEGDFSILNLVVPGNTTSQQLAMEIVGPLINNQTNRLRNVVYSGGTPASSGRFWGGGDIINIEQGAVLTSGKAVDVGAAPSSTYSHNSGSAGDSLLTSMLSDTKQTYNRSVLEFEFRPVESGTISFDFVFGSKEYSRSENKRYNDGFYFLFGQAGKNLNASHNIATVRPHNSQVVSVRNIDENTNSDLFIPNPARGGKKVAVNGFTKVMTTKAVTVEKNKWYKIRVAIADAHPKGDKDHSANQERWKYDSAVFIGPGYYRDDKGPKWPRNANLDVIEQCGIVTLSWPAADDPSIPIDYEVFVNGASQGTTQSLSYTLSLSPGPYNFSVVPTDARGNAGSPLSRNYTVTTASGGAEEVTWLGPGYVANGEVYDIQFVYGGCDGGEFNKTVAVKIRDILNNNKLIAGFVYGQSIEFNEETQVYSQLFDTARFKINDTIVRIFVYFDNKLRDTRDVIVGSP